MSAPRTTTPSGSTISTAALTARLATLTSANVGTVRGERFAACTHDTNVQSLTPSRAANAFCVSPLSRYARSNASRSSAERTCRPRSSRFASIKLRRYSCHCDIISDRLSVV